jgi:hypothetical protein
VYQDGKLMEHEAVFYDTSPEKINHSGEANR